MSIDSTMEKQNKNQANFHLLHSITIKSHNSIFKAMPVHLDNYSNSPSKHGLSPVPSGDQNLKEKEETAHLLNTMFGNVR